MTYPETGDLWEYTPPQFRSLYLIMEPVVGKDKTFNLLALDTEKVIEYYFDHYVMDLWRKVA